MYAASGISEQERNIMMLLPIEQRTLVEKYYEFYRSLEEGSRSPETEAQEHFVLVCQGKARPKTDHEIAYFSHIQNCRRIENHHNSQKVKLSNERLNTRVPFSYSAKSISKKKTSPGKSESPRADVLAAKAMREESEKAHMKMALERDRLRKEQEESGGICDYEEGMPRPGWFTDEDHKKMRSQDYWQMKNNHKD